MSKYIPILGHFKSGQKITGLILGSVFYVLLVVILGTSIDILPKIFNPDIGFEAGINGDNSLYLLIQFGFLIAAILIEALLYSKIVSDCNKQYNFETSNEEWDHFKDNFLVIGLLLPGMLLVVSFVIIPIFLTILISFTNYNNLNQPPFGLISWEGLQNYKDFLLSSDSGTDYSSVFTQVLSWTLLWTLISTTCQILLGTLVAFIFNQDGLRGKKFVMPIFLLTWAIPSFITIGMFSLMFSDSSGIINSQLLPFINTMFDPIIPGGDVYSILEKIGQIGMNAEQKDAFQITVNSYGVMEVPWKTNANLTKFAILLIQPLLGFPYVFTLVLGSLKSIPNSLYQAADMDGANIFQKITKITIPLLVIATLPVLITQYTFNFNNFGMIYLFNSGGPGTIGAGAGSTDILMSWVFKIMTGSTPDYGLAAAVSLIMSSFTVVISLIVFVKSNAFDKEDMR